MKRRILPGPSGIFVILLIPYLCTILVNGTETALLNRKFDVEMFLPAVVSTQISADYEMETIKAQSVIARSNFCRRMKNSADFREMIEEICKKLHPTYYTFYIPSSIYEKAVSETEGQVLVWKNKLKLVPYHEISAGSTRDGREVLRSADYEYLKAVESSADKEAPDFLNSTYIKARQMPQKLTIVNRDAAGYVTELSADGSSLEGESFRQGLGLDSANFTIQKVGDNFRFLCKGKGHGLGFSQYGGNVLVKNGNTYREILEIYLRNWK